MEQERARLVALLDRSEAMLAEMASRDDPALFAVVVDLQQSVLQLRAQVVALDHRAQRVESDE